MKSLLIAPAIMLMVLGFALELSEIAEDASAKSLQFADDMSNAIPCAAKGIPVEECSPGLLATNFTPEVNDFTETLQDFNETVAPLQELLLEEIQALEEEDLENVTFTCTFNEETQELTCSI